MYVWRVESKRDGSGPYVGQPIPELHDHAHEHGLPSPHREGLSLWNESAQHPMYCGFISADQLTKWFNNGWLERLHDLGYHVVRYRVRKDLVQVGNHQCTFTRAFATKLKPIPLTEVHTLCSAS